MMQTSSDLTDEERADAALVVRLLGTLAQTASATPGGDVEIRLLRACAAVVDDLHAADGFALDCLAALVPYSIERDEIDDALSVSALEVALRRNIGESRPLAEALGRHSRALESAGQWDDALDVLAQAFSAAQPGNDPELAVSLLLDRARILGTRFRRFEEALRALQEAHDLGGLELRQQVRNQFEAALSWILQSAGTAEDSGDTDTAARLYLLVDETGQRMRMPAFASQAQCNHARMLAAAMREPARALPLAERALAFARDYALADQVEYATQLIRAIRRDLKRR
jgi:tetratricopeptide (TPR) repeat protein